jgi:hypothetical protein
MGILRRILGSREPIVDEARIRREAIVLIERRERMGRPSMLSVRFGNTFLLNEEARRMLLDMVNADGQKNGYTVFWGKSSDSDPILNVTYSNPSPPTPPKAA